MMTMNSDTPSKLCIDGRWAGIQKSGDRIVAARRLRNTEARAILSEELAKVGWPSESAFTLKDERRPGAENEDWWHENTPDNERSETKRNLAYLRAYQRIAGDTPMYATGLLLERSRLWMDRSVISRLTRDGYLRFDHIGKEAVFVITDSGTAFMAGDLGNIA
jgi:hypothetical protein